MHRYVKMIKNLKMRDISYLLFFISGSSFSFSFSLFNQNNAIRTAALNGGRKRGILGELEFMNMFARRMQLQRQIGHGLNISSM